MRKKILFVDDERDVLNVSNMILKGLGHETLLASSGEKAIDIIDSNIGSKIDLIFLDLTMPGATGFDVLEFLNNSNIKIPVIVQTAVMDKDDLEKTVKLEAVDCITKPYTKEDVKYLINKHT